MCMEWLLKEGEPPAVTRGFQWFALCQLSITYNYYFSKSRQP